jgi:hypothetical protein
VGSKPWRAVAVLLVLFLQFAVPLVALVLPDKPNRLGWQMYSGVYAGDVVVTDGRGAPLDVRWSEVVARSLRPELDWTQRLPEHLCAHFDEPTITVTVGERSRTVTC